MKRITYPTGTLPAVRNFRKDLLDALDEQAWMERRTKKEVLERALVVYLGMKKDAEKEKEI